MNSLIIFNPNDMSPLFIKYLSVYRGREFLDIFNYHKSVGNIDLILREFLLFISKLIYPVLTNNILLLLSVSILLLLSCVLFRNLIKKNIFLPLLLSALYSTSLYLIFRVISFTGAMYLVLFIPLLVFLLIKGGKPVILGMLVFTTLSFTNYYGYFSFILVALWFLFDLVSKNISFKDFLKKMVLFITPVLLGIIIFFFPLLKGNLTFFKSYNLENNEQLAGENTTLYRPLEDWYNLSFRPWYFFIPPKSSVFFGEFSKNIHEKIKNTGYYLADDYMEEEMAGSYMGWHFLFGLGAVAVILLLKRYKNIEFKTFKTVYENKEMIIRSFFIIFCILLISGPPSFTIGGVEIYTPTYLLYYIVPVFRTLVRWAVVIYLFVLIINSFLVQDLYNLMKTKFQKILFILVFLTLNFVIFAIKIPVININKPPQEIAFVKEKYPESVPYAVYPKGDYYSIFWIISHEDLLINPVNFINYETGFDSNEFSKSLITEEGIQDFLEKEPKYLIYYPNNISDDDLEKISKVNPDLKSREDIYEFFKQRFGDGVSIGESVVFDIRD